MALASDDSHTNMHVCTCTCICIFARVTACMCLYVCTYYKSVYMIHIRVYRYVFVYIHIYNKMHIYIHIHISKHILCRLPFRRLLHQAKASVSMFSSSRPCLRRKRWFPGEAKLIERTRGETLIRMNRYHIYIYMYTHTCIHTYIHTERQKDFHSFIHSYIHFYTCTEIRTMVIIVSLTSDSSYQYYCPCSS